MRGRAGHFKGEKERKTSEKLDAPWTTLLGPILGIMVVSLESQVGELSSPGPSWDNVLVRIVKGR